MKWIVAGIIAALPFAGESAAQTQAQPAAKDTPWSAEFGIGWDNSISGNINSSAIGTINNQAVVITKNSYENVYGTGLHIRFGGGYLIDEITEVRATFTFQSLDADLTEMGDIGASRLYGQYADYQSFGLDVGLRRYVDLRPGLRAYGEATLGLAFIDETDVVLVAPGANLAGNATDFYDKTAAFTLGGNAGLMVRVGSRFDVFGQLGLRWVSGMSAIDNLEDTSLDTINDKSARWTMPFLAGVRVRF
jgi:opacity protein-like surface antigen